MSLGTRTLGTYTLGTAGESGVKAAEILTQGQTPTANIGVIGSPTQLSVAVASDALSASVGVNVTVQQCDIILTGGVPVGRPKIAAIATEGQQVSVAIGINATVLQLEIVTLGNRPGAINAFLTDALDVVVTGFQPTFGVTQLDKNLLVSRKYICTITGANNALSDVVIPISNISLRVSSDGVSSLQVVCPNGVDYASDILIRKDGGIVIDAIEIFADNSEQSVLWQEYAITGISSTQGARSFSVSVNAQTTITNTQPKKIKLNGTSFLAQYASGTTRVRCSPDKDLLPGDIAILEDDSEITVATITTTISPTLMAMEAADG